MPSRKRIEERHGKDAVSGSAQERRVTRRAILTYLLGKTQKETSDVRRLGLRAATKETSDVRRLASSDGTRNERHLAERDDDSKRDAR